MAIGTSLAQGNIGLPSPPADVESIGRLLEDHD